MEIYTDGAYSSLKNKGGWAFYCPEYHIRVCDCELNTTNNRMELKAAIKALTFIEEANISDKNITIISDSKYLVETMNGNYKRKTNLDLWDKLDDIISGLFNKNIKFVHMKGHTQDRNGNTIADIFANLISQI